MVNANSKKGEFAKMNFIVKLTVNQISELSFFINEKNRTLEEIKRAQSIILLEGNSEEKNILALTGLKRETSVKCRQKFIKHGLIALRSKRKTKKPFCLLTKKQKEAIAEMLNNKKPIDYGWDWDYWTSSVLAKIILDIYNVEYKSKSSLYLIFKQSRFSFHLPEKLYVKRNQADIDAWIENTKPIIEEYMIDADAVILTEDEMILTTRTTVQKVWLPIGKPSYVEESNVKKRKSFYGFFDVKAGIERAFQSDFQNSETTIEMLKKILNLYQGKKILLIWDNAPWHRSQMIKDFLVTCSDLLLVNFPPYAPEENPQEHIWKAARANVSHNKLLLKIEDISKLFLDYLNTTKFDYKFFGFKAQLQSTN